ncbi:MAG: hypothetical protein Q7V20_10065 [Aquabacterium sp.]|uniref:hypothetical protein n=1 Tax=Aquabacterium sp. TaxID=1872578 RepID=UPI00272767EB|nr:hypothetical protein [Aquabacterium sp.]MDO9003785.1 hypothetical protein [Aquabacterium sp.]
MQVTSTSPVSLQLKRQGGTVIQSRIDFWSATPNGWQLASSDVFQRVTKPVEQQSAKLAKGQYTAVFSCRVEESVNGKFEFEFDVNGVAIYADKGNVNTTPDPHDAKVYKDQFVLNVV